MPRCKHCRDKFEAKTFLQKSCIKPECLAIEGDRIYKEKVQQFEKQRKKTNKELREEIKTLSDYEKEAKAEFQKWIRFRDEKLPCISCGRFSNRYDGGHYWDAGVYSGLIFHEDNCHKQCSNFCNRMNHGNKANYRIGLVKKIGIERVEWLENNKDRLRNYKFTKGELKEIKIKYKKLNEEILKPKQL